MSLKVLAYPIYCPSIKATILLLKCHEADMPKKEEVKLFWWHKLDDNKFYRWVNTEWIVIDDDKVPIEFKSQ